MRSILLLDNGSQRPDSSLNLRKIAHTLSARCGEAVLPVSLLHSDKIPAEQLAGRPAEILAPTLRRLLASGVRDLVLIPLFFSPSRALSRFVPETAADLGHEIGPFRLRVTPELCPLPTGEPRLVDILHDNLDQAAASAGTAPRQVVLVDHGSPIPEVTAVRRWLGARLGQRLGSEVRLEQAVMERRPDPAYDFNGPLLEDLLGRMAEEEPGAPVILSMLFLSAGRHAGAGGDIDRIRERIERKYPGFQVYPSPLVGSHPALIDILDARLRESMRWMEISPGAG